MCHTNPLLIFFPLPSPFPPQIKQSHLGQDSWKASIQAKLSIYKLDTRVKTWTDCQLSRCDRKLQDLTAYNLHKAPSALRKAKASSVPSILCSRQMLRCLYLHTAKEQLFLEAEKHFQMEEISKKESKSNYSERLQCLHICCTTRTHTSSLTFPRTLMGLGNQIPFRRYTPDTYCNCSATPTTPDKM